MYACGEEREFPNTRDASKVLYRCLRRQHKERKREIGLLPYTTRPMETMAVKSD
jgi:hypothetical protein